MTPWLMNKLQRDGEDKWVKYSVISIEDKPIFVMQDLMCLIRVIFTLDDAGLSRLLATLFS